MANCQAITITEQVMYTTGEREAWDDPIYFVVAWPLMAILAGIIGAFVPRRPWRWGVTMIVAQGAMALAISRSANLLPFGLAIFVVLSVPCIGLAWVGGILRRKLARG